MRYLLSFNEFNEEEDMERRDRDIRLRSLEIDKQKLRNNTHTPEMEETKKELSGFFNREKERAAAREAEKEKAAKAAKEAESRKNRTGTTQEKSPKL